MKVELDEYEVWQLQYLVKNEISEIEEHSKKKFFNPNEETDKTFKQNHQMYSDILEKLKQT